jgi:hypothetical protein
MPLLVFFGSFHNPASLWKIRRIDYACGVISVLGTATWLVTRDGTVALVAAIAADFMAGIPTLMKSWTHPESETVYSYVGAVISMAILLLTVTEWSFEVVGFPCFILCMASIEVVLVGLEPGPRLRHTRLPSSSGVPSG